MFIKRKWKARKKERCVGFHNAYGVLLVPDKRLRHAVDAGHFFRLYCGINRPYRPLFGITHSAEYISRRFKKWSPDFYGRRRSKRRWESNGGRVCIRVKSALSVRKRTRKYNVMTRVQLYGAVIDRRRNVEFLKGRERDDSIDARGGSGDRSRLRSRCERKPSIYWIFRKLFSVQSDSPSLSFCALLFPCIYTREKREKCTYILHFTCTKSSPPIHYIHFCTFIYYTNAYPLNRSLHLGSLTTNC